MIIIYAGTHGHSDPIRVEKMRQYEQNLLAFLRTQHPEIGADIAAHKEITEEAETKLQAALAEFNQTWIGEEKPDVEISGGDGA